jgi:uncharacterized protein (TIGR02001 family)
MEQTMRQCIWGLMAFLTCGCSTLVDQTPSKHELGDFDLTMGAAPTRSMAQGLVQPKTAGDLHGGLDVSHTSGWYFGQWAANISPTDESQIKLDSYAGLKKPLGESFGYELGTLVHSYPSTNTTGVEEYYAGLSIFGNRLGASFTMKPDRQDHTLLATLDTLDRLGFGMTVKYSNHSFNTPLALAGQSYVRTFNDWSLNLSRPWLGFNLNMSYSDSSLTTTQCSVYSGINSYCEALVQFKASRNL